jgi:hypothetical protein
MAEKTWAMTRVDPYLSAIEHPSSMAFTESLDPSNAIIIFPKPGVFCADMDILEMDSIFTREPFPKLIPTHGKRLTGFYQLKTIAFRWDKFSVEGEGCIERYLTMNTDGLSIESREREDSWSNGWP